MKDHIKDRIDTFYAKFPAKTWSKGEIIIQAGDDPAGVYYVEQGGIRQYTINKNGDEVVVNVFKNPAFMPMSWAINGVPNEYFFETTEETTLRVAPREEALAFLEDNPDVAFDLLSRVFSGLDGMLMRMSHLMSSSAYVRILHELVIQSKRTNKNAQRIELPVKEYELGTFCGLTKETVSREFRKLKQDGLVEVSRSSIVVTDLQKLEAELEANL